MINQPKDLVPMEEHIKVIYYIPCVKYPSVDMLARLGDASSREPMDTTMLQRMETFQHPLWQSTSSRLVTQHLSLDLLQSEVLYRSKPAYYQATCWRAGISNTTWQS